MLKVDIPGGHEKVIMGTIADGPPIYDREWNIVIKVTPREGDGIATNGELNLPDDEVLICYIWV
jgi:hypothetical protein